MYAQNSGSTKYADLDQINKDTVQDLKVTWLWDSVDNAHIEAHPEHVPLGFKSTPIKIGDTLYVNTSMGYVVALDAVTGAPKWQFDTETWKDGRPANLGFNSRGVSYFEDGDKQRIILGTNNACLWSLDKSTGETVFEMELPGNPSGVPMTYMVNGKQYISVALGGAKDAKLVTLALP